MIVDKGRAVGVVAGGKAWRAKQSSPGSIPSCCSTGWFRRARSSPTVERRMTNWKCESATFRMNVALSELPKFTVLPKKGDHLTAGIIMAPSLDYMDRAFVDAKRDGWSEKPVIEMLIPSTLDPTLAPKGKHVASPVLPAFQLRPRPGPKLGQGEREGGRHGHRDGRKPCAGLRQVDPRPADPLAARPRTPLRADRRRYFPRQDGPRPIVQRPADDRRLPTIACRSRASICADRARTPAAE